MEKKIRCVNPANNKVRFFKKSICMSESWQKSTGFIPEPEPISLMGGQLIPRDAPTKSNKEMEYSPNMEAHAERMQEEKQPLWNMPAIENLIQEGKLKGFAPEHEVIVKPRGRPRKQIQNADRS